MVSATHLIFLGITVLAPVGLCPASRRLNSEQFDRRVARSIAGILLAIEIGEFLVKWLVERQALTGMLPMHLCDWALVAVAVALWRQAPRWFEVAYFWGLAGTIQGLLTPAIDPALALWRHFAFFSAHSGIVVGVLFLVFAKGMRPVPASLPRVLFWSEMYLVAALMVNALTGQNYGFLAHPPITPSLLDYFPQAHWLYVATVNAVALLAFAILYLPWWIADARRGSCT